MLKSYISWAIEENYLNEYLQSRHDIELNFKEKDFQAFLPIFQQKNNSSIMNIDGDTATIRIEGVLQNGRADFIDMLLGRTVTSYKDILNAIVEIKTNGSVKNFVSIMDTPGGQFMGVDAVWQGLFDLGKSLNTVAIGQNQVFSAGYYLASAMNEIHAQTEGSLFGSIGVLAVGVDTSEAQAKSGIKRHTIVSRNAPEKNADFGTEKGREIFQKMTDKLESLFLKRISQGRDVKVSTIKNNFGQGGIMFAKSPEPDTDDALSVGMIDKILNIADKSGGDNSAISVKSKMKGENMNFTEFLAANPEAKAELDRQLEAKYQNGVKAGKETAKTEFKANAEYAFNYLKEGSAYATSPQIQETALEVAMGEQDKKNLKMMVSIFDMNGEKKKSDGAQEEGKNTLETPPNPPTSSKNEELEASMNKLEKTRGGNVRK